MYSRDPNKGMIESDPSRQAMELWPADLENRNSLVLKPDPLAQVSCRLGDGSCANAHASALNHNKAPSSIVRRESILQLQRHYGNHYVQRILAMVEKTDNGRLAKPTSASFEGPIIPVRPGAEGRSVPAIQKAASDWRITGKFPGAASFPMRLFFDRGSSALDAAEAAKIPAIATPPGRGLTLYGYTSEEGSVAANTGILNARLGTVDSALSSAGHTGTRTKTPRPTAGVGRIDYRRMRSVEVVPVGGASAVPACAGGAIIPCGPVPNAFTTAQSRADTVLLTNAINALSGPPPLAATTQSLLTRFFGAGVVASTVRTNLTNLRAHVRNMPNPGRHRCANQCDASCAGSEAYNTGTGAAAVMTLCPSFRSNPDVDDRAGTLIHEGAHGTAGLATRDHAYAHERMISFLSTADALNNSDSYVLFVRLLNAPGSVTVGPATPDVLGGGMSPAEETAVRRTIAWLEKWLIWTYQEVAALYGTINRSRSAGAWTNTYYRATMGLVAPRFGLTAPPALPTMSDQVRVAAIHDRYRRMRNTMWGRALTINKVTVGGTSWASGPGSTLKVHTSFFGLTPRGQLDRLLNKIVHATTGISASLEPHYVALVDQIRTHRGGGSP